MDGLPQSGIQQEKVVRNLLVLTLNALDGSGIIIKIKQTSKNTVFHLKKLHQL
jgi:hypothetical protein